MSDLCIYARSMKRIIMVLLVLTAPLWAAETLAGVTVNNATVVGGATTQATVVLSTPAASQDVWVELDASGPVHVPMAVRIPAGQTSASFTVLTDPTDADVQIKIQATLRGLGPTVAQVQVLGERSANR